MVFPKLGIKSIFPASPSWVRGFRISIISQSQLHASRGADLAPDRRVIGGFFPRTRGFVDPGRFHAIGCLRRKQQMVDAQAFIPIPSPRLIIPEAVTVRRRIEEAESVGEAQMEECPVLGTGLEAA